MSVTREQAKAIVESIVADLCGRKGLDEEWNLIDEETSTNIMDAWVDLVIEAVEETP